MRRTTEVVTGMGNPHRAGRFGLVITVVGLLLAGCSGETIIPQADGTKPVLPAGHNATTDPPAPSYVSLLTDHGRQSPGVVASGGAAAPYNYAPTVVAAHGQYQMWWCSQLPGAARPGDQILYATATSEDGPFAGPDGAPADMVFGNSPNGFDSLHTCDPSVIEVGGTYYLYYTGTADPHGNANAIGLATSPDGVNWTRANGGAPIVSASGDVHRANAYGAGQPSVLFLDGRYYLMFTDTTGAAGDSEGTGQFVLRSTDPAFQHDVEALGQHGFTPVSSATSPRRRQVSDTATSDWMWVDALNAFAIAGDDQSGTTITFWDKDFTRHPYQQFTIPGAQSEGPGLVRTVEGHAPVSATEPCGQVPFDVLRATSEGAGPTGLAHFGLDVDQLQACQDRSVTSALLNGFAVPAPDRTVDVVVDGHLVEVERRSVALALAAGMVDNPPPFVGTLPVAAHLRPGAAIVTADGRPPAFLLDDGRLWVIGSPQVAQQLAQLNSSQVTTVNGSRWDAYPRGTDLSGLRP
jgi:hypothetical protein